MHVHLERSAERLDRRFHIHVIPLSFENLYGFGDLGEMLRHMFKVRHDVADSINRRLDDPLFAQCDMVHRPYSTTTTYRLS